MKGYRKPDLDEIDSRNSCAAEAVLNLAHGLIARVLEGVLGRVIDREIPSLRLALGDEGFERMLKAFFPHINPVGYLSVSEFESPPFRKDEYDEVFRYLQENRSIASEEADWVAACLSLACQGQNHLWQDMGLDNRGMLSKVFRTFFEPLADLNVKDMKWKKFLYKRLCEMDGLKCRSPSCSVCSDYNNCYGPEV